MSVSGMKLSSSAPPSCRAAEAVLKAVRVILKINKKLPLVKARSHDKMELVGTTSCTDLGREAQ